MQEQSKLVTINSYPVCKAIGGKLQSIETKTSAECLKAVERFQSSSTLSAALNGGKVILVGDSRVGKTCLFVRVTKDVFGANYKATIGLDFNMMNYSVYGTSFPMAIWDTAGKFYIQFGQ